MPCISSDQLDVIGVQIRSIFTERRVSPMTIDPFHGGNAGDFESSFVAPDRQEVDDLSVVGMLHLMEQPVEFLRGKPCSVYLSAGTFYYSVIEKGAEIRETDAAMRSSIYIQPVSKDLCGSHGNIRICVLLPA